MTLNEAVAEEAPKPAGTCAGYCCEAFNIGSPEEVEAGARRHGADGELVKSLVVHLGQFRGNPTGRTVCGKESTEKTTDGTGTHFHTCKAFDRETRRCTVYADRPNMCRAYPNGRACEFEGCDHGPTKGPDVGMTKTQIIERNARLEKFRMYTHRESRSVEITPEGMKKVLVTLTRPSTESTTVSLTVPEDMDPKQIEAHAIAGVARLGQSEFFWEADEGNTVDMDRVVAHVVEKPEGMNEGPRTDLLLRDSVLLGEPVDAPIGWRKG